MKRWCALGLLLVALGASSAEPAQTPIHFRAHARVALDAHGVPRQVEVDPALPGVIREVIEDRVMQWRFEPARVGGQPRAGSTTVFVDACAAPAPGDSMRVAVEYDWNGPGNADGRHFHPAPRYPPEAAKRGAVGVFRVVVRIGADGRASIDGIEVERGDPWLFKTALRDWVAAMRYVPEEIEGAPVATRVAIPVEFSIGAPPRNRELAARQREIKRRSSECMAAVGEGDGEPPRPVVLDSPFRPITTG